MSAAPAVTIHDLLAAHGPDAVDAWVLGGASLDAGGGRRVPPLTAAEARALASDWSFWARPGQRWRPGRERVTLLSGGRGAGKTLPASHAFCEAANDPDRWNGFALILGPEPGHVLKKCLWGSTGIVTIARLHPDAYMVPRVNQSHKMLTFPNPRGGGDGLVVEYASSADPKSMRGGDLGLLWADELGFFYHDKRDDNGNTAWEAAEGALRGRGPRGEEPKVIVTTTPSEAPVIEALFDDARAPWCPRCRRRLPEDPAHVLVDLGPGVRPLRVDGHRISPLFYATTSDVVRRCDACAAAGRSSEVVADVRVVVMPTLDNVAIAAGTHETARRRLATGRASALREWGGDRARSKGALVERRHLRVVEVSPGWRPTSVDWEQEALRLLGVEEVGVFVDPATTGGEQSCDTGVMVVGLRRARPVRWDDRADGTAVGGRGAFVHVDGDAAAAKRAPGEPPPDDVEEVLLLEDLSVTPEEVDGAPSAVWAPLAADAARRWGAAWVEVEDNQGGDEVVDAMRRALARGTTEAAEAERLRAERGAGRPGDVVRESKRRAAHGCRVDGRHRRANKRARWGWTGDVAAEGRVVLVCLPWRGGEDGVARCRQQLSAWVPDSRKPDGGREPKDAADAFVGGAQVLLRVYENVQGVATPALGEGWIARGLAELAGR